MTIWEKGKSMVYQLGFKQAHGATMTRNKGLIELTCGS